MKRFFFPTIFFFLMIGYVFFSYSLTAPNLILSSWQPYWQFQTWIWKSFFNDRVALTYLFTGLFSTLIIVYATLAITGKKWLQSLDLQHSLLFILLISTPLILASNALSYDIFNYLFNAKMIVVYQANPHQQVALDFAYDDWVRFMHNTHTPAPYGYGWSVLSLLPYSLGFGKLVSTWLSFKFFSWLSYFLLAVVYWKNIPAQNRWSAWLILLNPAVLLEIIGNSHNDLWMVVPALMSILVIKNNVDLKSLTLSVCLLAFSISIKLASVVIIPIWLIFAGSKMLSKLPFISLAQYHWAWLASIGLFLPLLTERSKYFLPWYITWSLVWIPFMVKPKQRWLQELQIAWQFLLISFSISSLYRYLPFLWQGNYDGSVVTHQILITWVGAAIITTLLLFTRLLYRTQNSSGRMNR